MGPRFVDACMHAQYFPIEDTSVQPLTICRQQVRSHYGLHGFRGGRWTGLSNVVVVKSQLTLMNGIQAVSGCHPRFGNGSWRLEVDRIKLFCIVKRGQNRNALRRYIRKIHNQTPASVCLLSHDRGCTGVYRRVPQWHTTILAWIDIKLLPGWARAAPS